MDDYDADELAQEDWVRACTEVQHVDDEICPCCGAKIILREVTQTYGGYVQQCQTCHWESKMLFNR